MFRLMISSLWDFRKSWRNYLIFSLFYLLLSSYVLIPFLGYFLNRLLLVVSSGVLINSAAFSLLLDPRGIIGLIILSTLAVVFTVIQVGTYIVLAHKNNHNKDILISEGFITSIVSIKRMVGLGALYLALLFFLIIPIVNIPIMPEMSEIIEIPQLLMDTIMGNIITRSAYFIMVALFIYLLLRLVFTLHEVLVEDQKVWKGMKNSFRLTKKISFSLLFKLLLFDIILFALGALFFTLLSSIPGFLDIQLNYIIRNYLITLSSLLTYLYSLILIPLNIIFITKLYDQAKEDSPRKDRLKTYNLSFLADMEHRLFRLLKKKRILLPTMLLLSILATFFMGLFINQNTIYAGRDVSVISHRAIVQEEFENSLEGIRASMEADIDIIEFDVMMTKDQVIVLHHDRTLQRTFGLPYRVNDLTYEELQDLEIPSPEGFPEQDPVLPTLDEAMGTVSGDARLLIDVKTNGDDEAFARELVAIIENHGMLENAYVQSFSNTFLNHVHALNPEIITAQIMYYTLGDLTSLDVDYYTAHHGMLSHGFVRRARQDQKGIWVWTVNTEEAIREVLQYDIDGIITNQPLLVKEILGRSVEEDEENDEEEGD